MLAAFASAYTSLDTLRQGLQHIEVTVLDRRDLRAGTASMIKGSAYVSMSAILERFVVDFSVDLRLEVLAQADRGDLLNWRLAALTHSGAFSRTRDNSRLSLALRTEVLGGLAVSIDDWDDSATFHDGKTVDAHTFRAIWRVMGLDGTPFPNPRTITSLEDIKARRNRVCHGEANLSEEGRRVTTRAVLSSLDLVQQQLEHMDIKVDDWLKKCLWKMT